MAESNTAVFGIYLCPANLKGGIDRLKAAGFPGTGISMLFPETGGSRDFACEKDAKAPAGATADEEMRSLTEGALEWLVSAGTLVIPGFGPFIAAGPMRASLAQVSKSGARGGIADTLIGMGIPEYEANRYEGRVKEGRILLSVHSDNAGLATRALGILEQTGAQDISSTEEASEGDAADDAEGEATLAPAAAAGSETADPSRNMAGIGVEQSV